MTRAHSADFGRVRDRVEHRLAEEGASEAHPVQSPDKCLSLPDLDRVGKARLVQGAVALDDLVVDPIASIAGARRTRGNDPPKVEVGRRLETTDRTLQAAGDMEVFERYDAAFLRRVPAKTSAGSHGEKAGPIGLEQRVDGNHSNVVLSRP